ncbi:heat shock protein DNAj [Niveomyces insectorum RCEF 264]|uniref:Heat shock protein DNAj n=1 Tax=Niveomyces insectorum RCEF 264 TaxID=1081102 RepID=A0A168A9N1_9HYPO|nr:heat shock protein DNAj [Niveomyces insectorum RCEF 264]
MAKVDFSRDYYADLEILLLALKYHPDRNPGKESEVNAKFQTIQAAHEVLTSPGQKSKYDAHRSRTANRYPTASGVRGNPWQDVAAQYPAPPRRPGQAPTSAARNSAGRNPAPGSGPSASSSAHRYSSFGVPPSTKTSKEDLDSRYTAWKNMRQAPPKTRAGQSASSAYTAGTGARAGDKPTATPSASGAASMPPPPPPPQPPPRTASQRQKSEASFGARRNTGFFPRSPMGDEPPAANTSNYFTNRTHTRDFSPDEESYQTGPSPSGQRRASTAETGFASNVNRSDESLFDTRQSTPYQTHGGEKLNPFDGVRGPASGPNRTKANRTADPQTRPEYRRRSSSLPDESDGAGRATANSRAGRDGTAAEGSRTSQKQAAGNNANTSAPRSSGTRARPGTDFQTPGFQQSNEQHQKVKEDVHDPFATPPTKSTQRTRNVHQNEGATSTSTRGPSVNAKDKPIFANLSLDDERFSTPTTPVDADQTNPFTRSSAEEINTEFVPGDKSQSKWEFSAGGSEAESNGDIPPHRVRRSQSGSRVGRRSPAKDGGLPRTAQKPPPPPPLSRASSSTAGVADGSTGNLDGRKNANNNFDAAKWAEQISSEHFVPQPPQQPHQAPLRQPTPSQASTRPTNGRNAVPPSDVKSSARDDSDEDGEHDQNNGSEKFQRPVHQQAQRNAGVTLDANTDPVTNGYASPVAMDIDSPSPANPSAAAGTDTATSHEAKSPSPAGDVPANAARNIPVEPTRPEWRAGNLDNIIGGASLAAGVGTSAAAAATPPQAGAKSGSGSGSGSGADNNHAGGSEDSEEFLSTLREFKKVEPLSEGTSGILGGSGSGLGSFGDLRTHLPFESKAASAGVPVRTTPGAKKPIPFPKPPAAPHPPPALAVPGLQPSSAAWDKYVYAFRQYMNAWLVFNSRFVDHFQARRSALEEQRRQDDFAWLTAENSEGVNTYLSWLEQDGEAQARWSAAHAEHEQNVRMFRAFWDRMKQQ